MSHSHVQWARGLELAALALLLAGVGFLSMQRKLTVLGADIGWHLKTGEWILEHHAVPHNGIFSRTAASRSWIAYSWGYEVLLACSYVWLGLPGVALYGTALTLLVVFAVFWMALRLSHMFWVALLLAAVGCYSILLLRIVPRPAFFSIALFCLVLTLLLEAQRSGRVQLLYWLPLVFLVWANLHIQFVYGLAALALLLAINASQRFAEHFHLSPQLLPSPTLPSAQLAMVFTLCVTTTMIGPYWYHLYGVVFRYSQAKVPYAMVQELQPFRLRLYGNYTQLLLAAAAFAAVVLQKKLDIFKLLLLTVATVFAFRTMRDAWLQCTVAVACLAEYARAPGHVELALPPRQKTLGWGTLPGWRTRLQSQGAWAGSPAGLQLAAVFAAVAMLLFSSARLAAFNQQEMQNAIAAMYPVDAVSYLQQHPAPGPLWNIFDWGGFLAWYVPQYPVAIDPRTDLYGDEMLGRFNRTEQAASDYRDDPYLNEAGVVLLRTRDPLTQLLSSDPRFQRAYADRLATVFVRR